MTIDPTSVRPFPRQTFWPRIRRRLFHTYFRFARGLTMGAQGCVLDEQNRVFLVRHTYIPGWHFPGGGVETGETVCEAVTRELAEEGNITLTAPPTLFGIFFNQATSRRDHVALFVVRQFVQTAPRLPDSEIAEAQFFALDDLPELIHPSTCRHLAEIIENRPASPIW